MISLLLVLAQVVETPHYQIDAPAEIAQECARILEAAYPQFQAFFSAKPKHKGKLQLVVLADAAGLKDKGALSANRVYAPESRIAYALAGATRYESRVRLLAAAATQFHWLSRMNNRKPAARWWEEGVPAYLAQHHWDGTNISLGVKPVIGYADDYPSRAAAGAKDLDLFTFVANEAGEDRDRAMSWALCRFLNTGNAGEPFKGYAKWARKMDGGNTPLGLFRKTYGRGPEMQTQLKTWIETQQPQLRQLSGDWSATGAADVSATAKKAGLLQIAEAPEAVEATILVPEKGRWLAGALLHYTDKDDYTVALLDWGGFIRIQRWQKTRWQTMERGQGPPKGDDGNYKLRIFRRGDQVTLMVGISGYGPWELPGKTVGLAIENCDVRFSGISWK